MNIDFQEFDSSNPYSNGLTDLDIVLLAIINDGDIKFIATCKGFNRIVTHDHVNKYKAFLMTPIRIGWQDRNQSIWLDKITHFAKIG